MTLVVPGLTNAADRYTSSEALGRWSDYWLQWLREKHGQETATLANETADRPDESQLDERPSKAVRTALSRLESETDERWETPTDRVTGMQKWEGRVLEVDDDFFSAELTPLGDGPGVIADFDRDLLAEEDDLQAGDVVYVTVRTVQGPSGPTRTSVVRLRRLGRWSDAEIADQTRRAKQHLAELESYID